MFRKKFRFPNVSDVISVEIIRTGRRTGSEGIFWKEHEKYISKELFTSPKKSWRSAKEIGKFLYLGQQSDLSLSREFVLNAVCQIICTMFRLQNTFMQIVNNAALCGLAVNCYLLLPTHMHAHTHTHAHTREREGEGNKEVNNVNIHGIRQSDLPDARRLKNGHFLPVSCFPLLQKWLTQNPLSFFFLSLLAAVAVRRKLCVGILLPVELWMNWLHGEEARVGLCNFFIFSLVT